MEPTEPKDAGPNARARTEEQPAVLACSLEVQRRLLADTRTVHRPLPAGPGTVVARIDGFALSANNITYGHLGDSAGYWEFFPTGDLEWGRLPVWGHATVVQSRCDQIPVGSQLYGSFPTSSHVVLVPGRARDGWFVDEAEHRRGLPPAYNAYRFGHEDPIADLRPVLEPVFMLSFLLHDMLMASRLHGADEVLITSGSAKASIGTAFLLAAAGVPVSAVTSSRNVDFCQRLGVYDRVIDFEQLDGLATVPTALVDIAGRTGLRERLASALGSSLRHQIAAGLTHHRPDDDTDRVVESLFFAPTRMAERSREWGRAEFSRRVEEQLIRFATWSQTWMRLERCDGVDVVLESYRNVLAGTAAPDVATLHSLT